MKNVVDVMSLQQRDLALKNDKLTLTDYKTAENRKRLAPKYLFECGIKLNFKPTTIASAAIIFHRFCLEINSNDYEEFLIAASCLYVTGKIEDEPTKIRDIINVTHSTLHRGSSPLELGDEYWTIRDAIIQAELLIGRVLKFNFNTKLSHNYMVCYLKSIKNWLGDDKWKASPIAKVSMSYLQDFHQSPKILNYEPPHIAIACISLTLQTYGIDIPLTDEADESTIWYKVFVKDLTKEKLWEIIECIIDVYNIELQTDNFRSRHSK